MSAPRLRRAVRAIVVDPDDRVALVRFQFRRGAVWATPGGGIEPGEDERSALARELDEELGLVVAADEVGPVVWTRTHVVPIGSWDGQVERYRLQRLSVAHEVSPRLGWERLRDEGVTAIRWWSLDELVGAHGQEFAPGQFVAHLATLLRVGPPADPIDVGV